MSKLLINESPLLVLPTLAKEIGLNEAIMLQQIQYWISNSDKIHEGVAWTYNTIEDWHKQFPFWSTRTIRRIKDSLIKKKLIRTANYNKFKFDKTLWYTVNHDEVDKLSNPQKDKVTVQLEGKMDTPIPKTSTKTITNTNIYDEIKELYHKYCPTLPKVYAVSDKRKHHINSLVKTFEMEDIEIAFAKAGNNKFLTGETSDWKADFEWLINKNNLLKVIEGRYAKDQKAGKPLESDKPTCSKCYDRGYVKQPQEDGTVKRVACRCELGREWENERN